MVIREQEVKVKYCPSCGEKNLERKEGKGIDGVYLCGDCGCEFDVSIDSHGRRKIVILKWGNVHWRR